MKNLILVIGRSGSGKDTLIRHAKEVFKDVYKIVSVPSYTDRPMRPTETDGVEHTFLTKDMFDEVLAKENVFAYTKIGDTGFRYCSTVEMLNRLDGDTIFYTPYRIRDYAIITLFLNCGMRVSELVGINLDDVDSELRSMRVTGKGNKERIIYLNAACRNALSEYLALRRGPKYAAVRDRALFLSRLEQRISVKTVQALVYKYLDLAGLEAKHYSVHKLRHTAATLMYQSGNVDVRVLKDILGHEQLNTTQIYTHVSNRSMEEAMEQNPLSAIRPPAKPKSEG